MTETILLAALLVLILIILLAVIGYVAVRIFLWGWAVGWDKAIQVSAILGGSPSPPTPVETAPKAAPEIKTAEELAADFLNQQGKPHGEPGVPPYPLGQAPVPGLPEE